MGSNKEAKPKMTTDKLWMRYLRWERKLHYPQSYRDLNVILRKLSEIRAELMRREEEE